MSVANGIGNGNLLEMKVDFQNIYLKVKCEGQFQWISGGKSIEADL